MEKQPISYGQFDLFIVIEVHTILSRNTWIGTNGTTFYKIYSLKSPRWRLLKTICSSNRDILILMKTMRPVSLGRSLRILGIKSTFISPQCAWLTLATDKHYMKSARSSSLKCRNNKTYLSWWTNSISGRFSYIKTWSNTSRSVWFNPNSLMKIWKVAQLHKKWTLTSHYQLTNLLCRQSKR